MTEGIHQENPVQHQGMEMDVEDQGQTEPLDGNHRARVGLSRGTQAQGAPGPQALVAEHLLHGRFSHGAAEFPVRGSVSTSAGA